METILHELSRALQARAYYLAIMLALAIPDICSALESEDGRTHPDKYKAWYGKYLADKFSPLTADDCYSLRCGVLHQGRSEMARKGKAYSRVLFTLPNPQMTFVHRNSFQGAFNLDAFKFCMDVALAAQDWFKEASKTENVKKNLPNLLQYRERGLAPYIVGIPLIA